MNTLVALIGIANFLLTILIWIIVIQAILSWLIAFNVINMHNQFVRSVYYTLDRLLDPLIRPIRNLLPDMGGIDLSPMILILGILLIQRLLSGIRLDMLIGG